MDKRRKTSKRLDNISQQRDTRRFAYGDYPGCHFNLGNIWLGQYSKNYELNLEHDRQAHEFSMDVSI